VILLAVPGTAARPAQPRTDPLQGSRLTLGLTLGWFVYLMSVLLFISALVHLILLATPVAHHHIGVDEGGAR